MKGIWKNLMIIGALAGVGYFGYKAYRVVNNIVKLGKTLPDYLKDIIDERPTVNVQLRLNSLSIAVGLSADAFENIDFDLDEQVESYICDYYPALSNFKINVQKYIKSTNDEEQRSKTQPNEYETVDADDH